MNKQPFWNNTYKNREEKSTFGEPSFEIKDIAKALHNGAKILDVGCGDGRNANIFNTTRI